MPTYVFRCEACKTDWNKDFRVKDKPSGIECPDCGNMARTVITASPVIFKTEGFPGNDMKPLAPGGSRLGRKPTHEELEYVEKNYPESGGPKKLDDLLG